MGVVWEVCSRFVLSLPGGWDLKNTEDMRNYKVVVVCSDTTTYSAETTWSTRKEADAFIKGVESVYKKLGKEIYISRVTVIKN